MAWDTVAIIGVGLIGGSIGMALKARGLAQTVIGIGRRPAALAKAKRLGAVDATRTDIARGVAEAELVIVCTPVEKIASHVQAAAAACPEGTIITDAGSTKAAIVAALDGELKRGAHFVGSHPLAGSEKTGCENGAAELFAGRVAVLTPSKDTDKSAARKVEKFWQSLGMKVIRMTPTAHDAALARTSHLPHVVASALAAATSEKDLPLVATGWLDTTRIAAADEQLWRQILLENKDNTLAALDQFEKKLSALRVAIAAGDGAKLARLLAQGKRQRELAG